MPSSVSSPSPGTAQITTASLGHDTQESAPRNRSLTIAQHPPRRRNMHSAPSPVMQRLSAYIAGALRRPLPPPVAEKTKHHLLDTIAAMLSGSRLAPGKKAISFARVLGGTKEAGVAGSRIVTAAANAALANGMLAHADETDDSHSASQTHPGCGVVAAALAMAERERAGGIALLRAVALGYDVCCRLTQSLDAIEFRAAGHSTHSFGPTFGAAAAAGALAGLDERRVRHLLSYAAQQASGISCWMRDEGHVEKAFDFGGMPARNGDAAQGRRRRDRAERRAGAQAPYALGAGDPRESDDAGGSGGEELRSREAGARGRARAQALQRDLEPGGDPRHENAQAPAARLTGHFMERP